MRRRWLLLAFLVVALPAATQILGQVRQQSGHGLDANLQLGSGGFNSAGRGAVGQRNTARLYRRPYSVSRPLSVQRDYYNTMWTDRQYSVARSVGHAGGAPAPRTSSYQLRAPSITTAPAPARTAPAPARTAPPVPEGPEAETTARLMEQISYGIGFYLGQEIRAGLAHDGVGVEPGDVIRGFGDGLRSLEPAMPREQIDAILAAIGEQLRQRVVTQRLGDPAFQKLHDENLARSRAFHEAFGAQEGVITLPTGIQYEVLEAGTGEAPGPTDTVVGHIRVSHTDGTEIARWDAAEVRIDSMVAAGAQVLPLMKVGGRWRTAIPPQLAYGAAGDPPAIGPNETILAEVELLEIK
ncbi:MAG: FKBP-type peptidyl-prolyl cis-trans isomerase N-terminal domain-containing protein [Planctomycetota bacterium]|jgi:FKBP-type peptidyl-prolyl cis-trans isomerase FklB